jgi:hypothetical protein
VFKTLCLVGDPAHDPYPSASQLQQLNLHNVNAGDILVGGIESGAGGSVEAALFEASFSGLSSDNVFADDIVIGASPNISQRIGASAG